MATQKNRATAISAALATVVVLVMATTPATAGPAKLVFDLKDCALSLDPINCLLDVYCEGQRLPDVNVQRCHLVDGWCVGTIIPEHTLTHSVDGLHVIGNVFLVTDVDREDYGVFVYQGPGEADGTWNYAFLGFSSNCA